jgi:hypothetical protein
MPAGSSARFTSCRRLLPANRVHAGAFTRGAHGRFRGHRHSNPWHNSMCGRLHWPRHRLFAARACQGALFRVASGSNAFTITADTASEACRFYEKHGFVAVEHGFEQNVAVSRDVKYSWPAQPAQVEPGPFT